MPLSWCKLSLHPATKDKFVYPTEFPRYLAMRKWLTVVTKLCLGKRCHHIVRKAGWSYKCLLFFGDRTCWKHHQRSFWFQKAIVWPRRESKLAESLPILHFQGGEEEALHLTHPGLLDEKFPWIRVKISKKGTVTDAVALRERWCWPLPIPLISPNGWCLPMFIWPLPFTSCFSAMLFFFPDGNTMFHDKTDTKNNAKFV